MTIMNIKKITAVTLAALMALAMVTGCGSKENTITESSGETTVTETTTMAETTTAAETEVKILVEVNKDKLPPEIKAEDLIHDKDANKDYVDLQSLKDKAKESGKDIVFSDSKGNEVTVGKCGRVFSDTGKIVEKTVDPKTGKTVTPATEVNIDKMEAASTESTAETETTKAAQKESGPASANAPAQSGTNSPATTQPAVQQPVNQPQETEAYQAPPEACEHTHTWTTVHHDAVTHQEPIYRTVHHDAVYDDVWVEDSPAWYEDPVYEIHEICDCGFDITAAGLSVKEIDAHLDSCGSFGYGDEYVLISEGGWHDATGHYESQMTAAAWDEEVIDGYRTVTDSEAWDETYCTGCGERK